MTFRRCNLKFAVLVAVAVYTSLAQADLKNLKLEGASNMVVLMKDSASNFGKKSHVGISLNSNGSAAAVECLNAKKCDLGFINQDVPVSSKTSLDVTPFAHSPIQIIVSKSLPISSLTLDQAKSVFSGRAKNWKEVGGPDLPIKGIQRRPNTAVTKAIIATLGLSQDFETVDAVQAIFNRFKGKGYEGAVSYTSGIIPAHMKELMIDGVGPTAANVRAGKYLMTQTFFLAKHKDAKDKDLDALIQHLMDSRKELFAKEDLVIP